MKLEFHPEAEEEFLRAVLRYEAEVPGLGERFHGELEAVASVLLDYPELGVPIASGLRSWSWSAFPIGDLQSRA